MEIKRQELGCDVLIAGGGIAGLCCAAALKEQSPELDILIVEKQTAGYGGKANKGGGVLQYFQLDRITPMDFLAFHVNAIGCYLGDQEMMLKYVEMNHALLDKLSSWGVNVPKNEDGSYNVAPTGPFTSMICVDLDITLQIRRRAEKLGVRILDKTAMAELFVENGEIRGAAAYSILDGTFYAIRAKKVVLATGSQNYRIASMWSSGRGDGIAAAYRAGAKMRNAEFGNFAQLMKVKSHNEVVFGENFMYNAKGEHVTENFCKMRETDINSSAIREWYLNMQNGTGPIHLDFGPQDGSDDQLAIWKRPYGQKFRDLNTESANEVDKDLEVCPLFIGEQSPICVEHDMQTSIAGLYAIGDCSYSGSGAPGAVPAPPGRNRGSGILNAVFAAVVCAEGMKDVKMPEGEHALCPEAVADCFKAVYAPLERSEGHRAKEVIALVQQAMAPMEQSVYMKLDRMEKALEYVKQAKEMAKTLRAEDMHDLLACHEAEAMVLSAEMHYTASMARRESRGWFLREDYPQMDNENWLKWIIIQNKDDEMTLSTEDVPIEKWPIQPAPTV